ncbi:21976_t:CDS:2, partial [Gigaspora rosea]
EKCERHHNHNYFKSGGYQASKSSQNTKIAGKCKRHSNHNHFKSGVIKQAKALKIQKLWCPSTKEFDVHPLVVIDNKLKFSKNSGVKELCDSMAKKNFVAPKAHLHDAYVSSKPIKEWHNIDSYVSKLLEDNPVFGK